MAYSWMKAVPGRLGRWWSFFPVFLFLNAYGVKAHANVEAQVQELPRFIQVAAKNSDERSKLANTGFSIEAIRSDSVWGFASKNTLKKIKKLHFKVLGNFDYGVSRGGHDQMFDFPTKDARYHNLQETIDALNLIEKNNSDNAKVVSIGKSVESRDIWAIHFNTDKTALSSNQSNKPGIVFMGAHHAREHLSVEIPLMLAQYLMNFKTDPQVQALLETRDIWIIPMVNPDGAEYDIATGSYQLWRKNRVDNQDGTHGVDLNRNYSFKWGTGGSSNDTSDETYMGPKAFSEPESSAIRDFVDSHLNLKILLSFHSFSELILYPWGHTKTSISKADDLKIFEKMATTMAKWNGYTPEQSSDLYIASGDTTDWAYGVHGIFAFTFELSPNGGGGGFPGIGGPDPRQGFYPGPAVINQVFGANINPCMYLIDMADDPKKSLVTAPTAYLQNYVEPQIDPSLFWGGGRLF